MSKAFSHYPAANTAAIVGDDGAGRAALTDPDPEIAAIHWSYDAAPTGGRLSITIDTVVVYDVDITAAGPGAVSFGDGELKLPAVSTDLDITLAAGGAAVTGKLNVFAK